MVRYTYMVRYRYMVRYTYMVIYTYAQQVVSLYMSLYIVNWGKAHRCILIGIPTPPLISYNYALGILLTEGRESIRKYKKV